MLPTESATSYVYHHIDPDTRQVRYIGCGSRGRAWACTYSPDSEGKGRYGNRSKEHNEWLNMLFAAGYTMGDIVHIVDKALIRKDALALEKGEIGRHDMADLFNRPYGRGLLILTEDQLKTARQLRGTSFSYERIGNELNVSTMTIYRALNGQTEGYRV